MKRSFPAGIAVVLLGAGVAAAIPEPDVKTLEDIRIEGEIRLPRVLFITSRDSERPLDYLEYYLPAPDTTGAEDTPIPVVGRIPPLDESIDHTAENTPAAGREPAASNETNDAREEVHP